MPAPYISRPKAEAFLSAIASALQNPSQHPVVFHVWGTGGVGKSTLTRKVNEAHHATAQIAEVSFGLTEGIDEPIPLMAKLYQQLSPSDSWNDPFLECYELYQETLHKLETEPVTGREVGQEQQNQVKQLAMLAVDVAGEVWLSESGKKLATTVVNRGTDAAVAMLSLKDGVQQLLQQHKATRRDQKLQQLMLEPVPRLTQAFVEGLREKAKRQPVVLVLDTYEKVPFVIDSWLWRTLLANTPLQPHRVRLVVAGRYCVLKTEGWRKLQQDRQLVDDYSLDRFDLTQTQTYLNEIDITDSNEIEDIYRVTKGLPYYLNWIRQERRKGRQLDFAQGNQEIVRLLLQGLDDTQKQVVQLAACCRQFDRPLIDFLIDQQKLTSAPASSANWYDWLTQLTFVEPVKHQHRLDDVAHDVFHLSLWQDNRDRLEQVHTQLAMYFKGKSDRVVPSSNPPPAKYNNPDWREPRANYLYHLLLTQKPDLQRQWLTHLLEARYFDQDELVQIPLNAIEAEAELEQHPCLSYMTRQFLMAVKPAVEHGWAVLEEEPINYPYNQEKFGLSKEKIDRAIQVCLGSIDTLDGLAKFAALLYQSKRCLPQQKVDWLLKAQIQAEQIVTLDDRDFSSGLFLWEIGNALYDLTRYEDAIASYDRAVEIKADPHEAWYNRGIALYHLTRYEEAIASFDRAIAIKANKHEAWNSRGIALAYLTRYEEAIASYDKAIEIKPDDHEAWNNRGSALYHLSYKLQEQGKSQEALAKLSEGLASYDKAIAIKADDHKAWFNRGLALYNSTRYEEAIASYDKAIAIKADDHEAWYNKACCYGLQGDVEQAVEWLRGAIELYPQCREKAKTDTDFDAIRGDARFQAVVG